MSVVISGSPKRFLSLDGFDEASPEIIQVGSKMFLNKSAKKG